ncbi:DUF2630 family protein [Streptomyces glomeratus]|uniref:DUF2630 family protein n=1 Tax=Streptomyces glomeratus TaxID=284452 RepID=A0ABP6LJ20_9ACTN|nr:DUF2630 family protein [Streptomyces glomeratus]MCF1508564.1 DUF2630 family protein [Streptomyces glomeratus]
MDQEQILARISAMVDEERGLRDALRSGRIDSETEQERLVELERALDQCWDLLRQRRAKAEFGENPDDARVRPASQVEDYES